VQTHFRSERDNSGQHNQFFEAATQFKTLNGQNIRFTTGSNRFRQTGVETVTNIPVQVGWEGKIGTVRIQPGVGVDLFNRLPGAINLHLMVETPISRTATLSVAVDQAPYKTNAKTLENAISSWRYGPSLYWQIDPKTSLFSTYRWGNYSDRNSERQSFSRLEHRMGQFSVATNLFSWHYAKDMQQSSGYFSPADFLIYNGELAWQGDVLKFLNCRLAGTLGRQRVNHKSSGANIYQALCVAKISPRLDANLGYTFSNERNRNVGAKAYQNQTITGKLQLNF
jgi:hypothetical protein